MKNKFVTTAKGFIKNVSFDKGTFSFNITYTHILREALLFTKKGAIGFIEKHKLEGFIYSPWLEEPLTEMYEVKFTNSANSDSYFYNEMPKKWVAQKAIMKSETDAKFLYYKDLQKNLLYTKEEAEEIARNKNKEIINNILNV